jgi:outer membrane protein
MATLHRSVAVRTAVAAAVGVALLAGSPVASAEDWLVRVGVHSVNPKSDNHPVVNVDSGQMLTFNVTYKYTDNWGVELLAALPFSHDINLNANGTQVGKTKHLPPTLSLQYHFAPQATIRPYVGVGLNYTLFFEEKTQGALAGTKLELDPSFGLAGQVGMDVALNDKWFVNADVRYIDIDSDAKLNGASLNTVNIDPYVIGVSIGRRFGGK